MTAKHYKSRHVATTVVKRNHCSNATECGEVTSTLNVGKYTPTVAKVPHSLRPTTTHQTTAVHHAHGQWPATQPSLSPHAHCSTRPVRICTAATLITTRPLQSLANKPPLTSTEQGSIASRLARRGSGRRERIGRRRSQGRRQGRRCWCRRGDMQSHAA
jgi:hypothetical protein